MSSLLVKQTAFNKWLEFCSVIEAEEQDIRTQNENEIAECRAKGIPISGDRRYLWDTCNEDGAGMFDGWSSVI